MATPPTDADRELIASVRAARVEADTAEVRVLTYAVAWAHTHLEDPADESWPAPRASAFSDESLDPDASDPEDEEWFGIPVLRWDAAAGFASANRMTTTAGRALIRDALILHHRLPRTWAAVQAGRVPAWRARRIAQAVIGAPADVAAYVDLRVAHVAGKIGVRALDALLAEAMMRLYPEDAEIAAEEARETRHATLDTSETASSGLAEMIIRGDYPDLLDFDRAVGLVAEALARQGSTDSLSIRRAAAVGILADPEAALALLDAASDATSESAPTSPAKPRREVVLFFHLSEAALRNLDPVSHDERHRPVLTEAVRAWCLRSDSRVVVRPVLDLEAHQHTDSYAIPDGIRDQIALIDPACVFPWCARIAKRCDLDHTVPHAAGGPGCTCNLAPLCRHHHRLKTHAGWTYVPLDRAVYLWTDPHGQRFLRDRGSTIDVTDNMSFNLADTG